MDTGDKDPAVVLAYLVGRPLSAAEMCEALGYSRATYYRAAQEGRLVNPSNLLNAARHFRLNPLDLFIRWGMLTDDDVREYIDSRVPESPDARRRRVSLADIPSSPDVPTL